MAEVLDTFNFTRSNDDGFPWDEWTNGQIWRIKRGEDFTTSVDAMRQRIRRKEKDLKAVKMVKTALAGEDAIVFQFILKED
jgi:hypothetical protein